MNAIEGLWESVGLDTSYFQFMADNTTELNSFDWGGLSKTSWYNMPNSPVPVIDNLGYNITNNSAEIEFRIKVPVSEPTGAKGTNITVTGVMSDPSGG